MKNNNKTEKHIKRFDFNKAPKKGCLFLQPIVHLLSFPSVWKRRLKINRNNTKGIKPPYILLCTHHAFIDFKVTTAAIFPHRANYIVAIDGFIGIETLLRNVGGIGKRKFTNDIRLIRQIKHALEKHNAIVAIYPEARYSLIGTNAILPDSLGKTVRLFKKPVLMLNMHGNFLSQPVWNLHKRKLRLEADFTQIISADEIDSLSLSEINNRIQKAFYYDEFAWQFKNKIKITYKNRAKNLHAVLYTCPSCFSEYKMDSDGAEIWCNHCGKKYFMDEYGRLHANQGETEFPHIPDWYEFERARVKKEIQDNTYSYEDKVLIESLPNARGYIKLGEGYLKHTKEGFVLQGRENQKAFELVIDPLSLYSLHIEYNYKNKGDCIDLSTLNDTYYIYPQTKPWVTKLHFAVEELYKIEKEKVDLKIAAEL